MGQGGHGGVKMETTIFEQQKMKRKKKTILLQRLGFSLTMEEFMPSRNYEKQYRDQPTTSGV